MEAIVKFVTAEQIVELESRLSEADKQIEDLSDVVADQSKRIELLEQRVIRLMEQAMSAGPDGSVVLGDEPPPPHW